MRRTGGDGAAEVGIVGDCNVQSSVSRWLAAAIFAFWAALAGLSGVVRADSACHIGKPLYCMKYAGMICPKENPLRMRPRSVPNGSKPASSATAASRPVSAVRGRQPTALCATVARTSGEPACTVSTLSIGRTGAATKAEFQGLGAAARRSRSLIASPRPPCGIGITAMVFAPVASRARNCTNRLAAASTRSPSRLRFCTGPLVASECGPKASSASSGATVVAFNRTRADGA